MLKVYSGEAGIFSYLSLQKGYFYKLYYLSDRVYFQLPWFLKCAFDRGTEAAKDDSYI